MTTNLFTQDLNLTCTSLPVHFGYSQNLTVNFKDYDVLTDGSYDYWLYILMYIFISARDDRLYHYVIANDVIILGRKISDEPFFKRFIETNCPKEPVRGK